MSAKLPEPDAVARAHSQKVVAHVRDLLDKNGGWLSLRDYMQAVLYAPGLGYYMAGAQKFGDGGDFVTAPELSPLYAQIWATPINEAMQRSAPTMLELGGGSGVFAAQLLRQLQAMKGLPERYAILELSPTLRARQRQTLSDECPDLLSCVEWWDHLPDVFAGVVFMNEVLDAIPPRVIERAGEVWREHGVTFDGERFVAASQPLSDPALLALAASRFPEQGDYVAELNVAGEALLETLGRSLTAGSTLFINDYGFERGDTLPAHYARGTLRAYYQHRVLDDPLLWPGLLDITYHVDFVAMAEAAQRGGLTLASFQTQGEFLQRHGILDALARCVGNCNAGNNNAENDNAAAEAAYLSAAKAVRTLIDPDAMGGIFKVAEFRLPPNTKRKYQPKQWRIFADTDNERPFDSNIVGLTKNDEVSDFSGRAILIKEGDYLYLYMDCGNGDCIFSEGLVIKNPYPTKPYKWCCKLSGEIEYMSEYEGRFSDEEKRVVCGRKESKNMTN
ncbi:MAG: SAM-dependent methyltransferase [Betaproteobacteria bacterium]|nr:SAM-dependent methyltransferase [Betaproteobacteria bacterium]